MRVFKINKVVALKEKNGLQNVINRVEWSYGNNVEGDSVLIKGVVNLQEPEPENFIDSESVSVDMLIEWINNTLSEKEINRLDTLLDNQLNEVVLDIQ